LPRYTGVELSSNLEARKKVDLIAHSKKIKTQQLVLAWIQAKGIVPIPGTTNPLHLIENLEACKIKLSQKEIQQIDQCLDQADFQGPRYPSQEISGIYPEKEL
jgi:diketogulonate reductase-like aldo/keto reductase